MNIRPTRKICYIACIIFAICLPAFAETVISADLAKNSYVIGDQVIVRINVSGNAGLHGLYFDLGYDQSCLSFIDLQGSDIPNFVNKYDPASGRLLYAVSDAQTSSSLGSHIIASFTMADPSALTQANGCLAEIRFRVIANSAGALRFSFKPSGSGAMKLAQNSITARFVDSPEFTARNGSGNYVQINSPQGNEAIYSDTIPVSVTSNAGSAFYYIFRNSDNNNFESERVSAKSGYATNVSIPVVYELNHLSVALYDGAGNELARDSRVVFRSKDETFVKIISPIDHALVSSDMVKVQVASPFDSVRVNGMQAVKLGEKLGSKNLYSINVWLKSGFNVIKAEATDPQGIKFSNSITLYYQRDNFIFKFKEPVSDSVIKPAMGDPQLSGGNLLVRGEIGTAVKTDGTNNSVVLRAIFTPDAAGGYQRVLIRDQAMKISENTATTGTEAPYQFANEFPISLAGLENGTLELIAFKNKTGTSSEAEIHRIVHIYNNRLSINLIQPNIIGKETLDSRQKVRLYNNGQDPAWGSVDLSKGGQIGLAAIDRQIVSPDTFGTLKITDLIETRDGTKYALVNTNNIMRLYRKSPNDLQWVKAISDRGDMYGYSLCDSDQGLLIGVSNLYGSNNSGLYLLESGTLKNISIGQPIPHVQFIINNNGTIFIYGNDYSSLYSFDLSTMEDMGNRYRISDVAIQPFENNLFIKQFVLSSDAKTGLILSNDGKVKAFQNLDNSGFRQVFFDPSVLSPDASFDAISKGEYIQGAYSAYVLVSKAATRTTAQVIMEQKATRRMSMITDVPDIEPVGSTLIGIRFANDRFILAYQKRQQSVNNYEIKKCSILFNQVVQDALDSNETFTGPQLISPNGSLVGFMASADQSYLIGYNAGIGLYELNHIYPETGTIAFSYVDKDAEFINGFHFSVNPAWLASNDVKIAFSLRNISGGIVTGTDGFSGAQPAMVGIKDFLAATYGLFKVSSDYDSVSDSQIISVVFTSPQIKQALDFAFQFSRVAGSARSITNLSVDKKIAIRLPRSPNVQTILPIQGYVSDPTAHEISIQETMVTLEKNGYFTFQYPINTAKDFATIRLGCSNDANEKTSLQFTVQMFDSLNALKDIVLSSNGGTLSKNAALPNELTANKANISVSGSFFGLDGVVVGYETYSYVYVDGAETLKKVDSGVFQPIYDDPIAAGYTQYGSGYVSGAIANENISLVPGKQRLVVYAENPGGKRVEYLIDGKYPDLIYNLEDSDQKIVILNTGIENLATPIMVSTVPVDKMLSCSVNESNDSPYVYQKSLVLSGKVISQFRFTDLKVRSDNPGILFSNGQQEIVISVDDLNRFEFPITMTIPESLDTLDTHFLFIPTSPFLEWMKTGMTIHALKDFTNTHIIPDFSLMDAGKWSPQELSSVEKVLRIKIARHIPAGTYMSLSVNFDSAISGSLFEETPGSKIYQLLDANKSVLTLKGLKSGINRIRWELSRGNVIASSVSDSPDMHDYLLDINFTSLNQPTVISFPIDPKQYYGSNVGNTIPSLNVTKQRDTVVKVYLNGDLIALNNKGTSLSVSFGSTVKPIQGRNTVDIEYAESSGKNETVQFNFLYDSQEPGIEIGNYSYVRQNSKAVLSSLNVLVHEANIKVVKLKQHKGSGDSVVGSSDSYSISNLGDQVFQVGWTKLEDNIPALQPTKDEYLFVEVQDYAGNTKFSKPFEGIANLPQDSAPAFTAIDIDQASYSGVPYFVDEAVNWGNGSFTKRLKIYNADITYPGLQVAGYSNYQIQRSGVVTLGGGFGGLTSGKQLTINSGAGVVLQKGFTVPKGARFTIPKPNKITNPVSPMLQFSRGVITDRFGISFWFRYEHEPIFAADNAYRKILTLSSGVITNMQYFELQNKELGYEYYLAYKDVDPNRYGDEVLLLVEWRGERLAGETQWGSQSTTELSSITDPAYALDHSGPQPGNQDGWNLITVSASTITINNNKTPVFLINVNNQEPRTISLYQSVKDRKLFGNEQEQYCYEVWQQMFPAASVYTFGNTNGTNNTVNNTSQNGHFSIARPLYANEIINNADIFTWKDAVDTAFKDSYAAPANFGPVSLDFSAMADGKVPDIGNAYYQVRSKSETISDYYSGQEDAQLGSAAQGSVPGAFRATQLTLNRLKFYNGFLMFRDSNSAFADNLTVTNGAGANAEWLLLTPTNSNLGRYSFGNNLGSHDLTNDRWFSITGSCERLAEGQKLDATLVVSINGIEKRYQLPVGPFHCIYPNAGNMVPTQVVMYIETKSGLKLNKNLIFTEGNFRLPEEAMNGFADSSAFAKYAFKKSGTIDFWYKPMHANKEGFVDYPATVLDSEFITISTVPDSRGHTSWALRLSGYRNPEASNPGTPMTAEIDTAVPVRSGWQHIVFTWDQTAKNQSAFLYVDGKIAGKLEGDYSLPVSLSMYGMFPSSENVFWGTDAAQKSFANGYIDRIRMLNKCTVPNNEPLHLLTFIYTDGFDAQDEAHPNLEIVNNYPQQSLIITSVALINEAGNLVFQAQNTKLADLGLNISQFPAGSYSLSLTGKVGNVRYDEVFRFVKNDRPIFLLKGNTALMVSEEPSDLHFDFAYQTENLLEKDLSRFSGLEVIVEGKTGVTPFTKKFWVVQDFTKIVHNDQWLLFSNDNYGTYTEIPVTNNEFSIVATAIKSNISVNWTYRPFYFSNKFQPDIVPRGSVTPDCKKEIPLAGLEIEKIQARFNLKDYEYKLKVNLKAEGTLVAGNLGEFSVRYSTHSRALNQDSVASDSVPFNSSGVLFLYYDDMLKSLDFDHYDCTVALYYKDVLVTRYILPIEWKGLDSSLTMEVEKHLNIKEFSMLQLYNSGTQMRADLMVSYQHKGIFETNNPNNIGLFYDLEVLSEKLGGGYETSYTVSGKPLDAIQNFAIIPGIPIVADNSIVHITIYEGTLSNGTIVKGLTSVSEITVSNKSDPPQIVMTESVPSFIPYNNVRFAWSGLYRNVFDPTISYSYNLDGKGWSAASQAWQSVEFFNMADGQHQFKVKAYRGAMNVSQEAICSFYIDVHRPVIDTEKIQVVKKFDSGNYLYAIKLKAGVGALTDSSLRALTVNDIPVALNDDGSFESDELPIAIDGNNPFVLTAYDAVGNYSAKTINVDNKLSEILYPADGGIVRYTPISLNGKIATKNNNPVAIYVRDPLTAINPNGGFDSWHKARVNEDFTFFVEGLTINPGSRDRQAHTALEMVTVSQSGHRFTKTIDVYANEVTRPIDLTLSVHAVEGQQADTRVTISAQAKVDDVSSWSIDFNGDGIYDDVVLMDDPAKAQQIQWEHAYSTLGIVKPRVRVITKTGISFTAEDSLIIHEKIKEASNKAISNPVALANLTMPDNSQRLYVLAGQSGSYRVEVYEIGRNDTYVSNKLYQIALTGLGIDNPVKLAAYDSTTLYIAENKNGRGIVHTLKADEFDAFSPVANAEFSINDDINSMRSDNSHIYVSRSFNNEITTVDTVNGLPQLATLRNQAPSINNEKALGGHLGLATDPYGLLVSDYDNQRIVRLSENFSTLEYMGEQGNGEGQFIKPASIVSYLSRIAVFDEARGDIQLFDPEFKPVTRLSYNASSGTDNYFDSKFLNSLAGMTLFARTESNRLFYYAVLLSKSSNKLAVLRLPQWEELRASVRNNKIIFLKDGEVYTAKPSGSDLSRLISSDSIPRISGSVDYPTLSPDGSLIAFTSRAKLYDGSGIVSGSSQYAYDNLYSMGTNGSGLTRIPMSGIAGYEIERPEFNSNGTRLIFSAKPTGGTWQIYVYDFATGSITRLFNSDENARFPYYSPDDRYIAFSTDYDGDQDIQIFDTLNPTVRISVTNNGARDSYPVWGPTFPNEIANRDYKVESKIAYVSERGGKKSVYYTYISKPSSDEIRVIKKNGDQVGANPDEAAIEANSIESDYPCFTGDGTGIVSETFDGTTDKLLWNDILAKTVKVIPTLQGSRRPAGMKNTITKFLAEVVDGNSVRLSWNRYTDSDIFYTVRFQQSGSSKPFVEKRVFSQDGTVLSGLDMNVEYLFQVSIQENGQEVAASQWTKLLIPEVAARPSYQIDQANPYLVHLKAWKPKDDTNWGFSWIIDNQEIPVQSSSDYLFEFATSGSKTIILKAHNHDNTYTSVSSPLSVNIVSDVKPVVEYVLADDRSYVELSAQKSAGQKIDWSSAVWTVTGPGLSAPQVVTGSKAIVNTSGFAHKINVNLRLSRLHVNGQPTTDTMETNLVLDLDYKGTKLVVTQEAAAENARLITFSAANSIGNINWREARWSIMHDGSVLLQQAGISSFAFEFPESNNGTQYSVSLSAPSMSDGKSYTVNNLVSIGAKALQPDIDYEIIELKNDKKQTIGAKLIFSAANSKGNGIDYSQAKWTVPVAGNYGDQPTQIGPTAVYNLFNVGSVSQVQVSLTLSRRGGSDPTTVTKTINIKGNQVAKPELVVQSNLRPAGTGNVLELDVLSSTGPNIDWERTEWQFSTSINGQSANPVQKGPVARLDIPASSENTVVRYSVTLYITGEAKPLVRNEELRVNAQQLRPILKYVAVPGGQGNVYNFSVADTAGVNIDWERTTWYFYDGNETIAPQYGAQVTHAFLKRDKAMGYPVSVLMYYKNSTKPFYGYVSVNVDADAFVPSIQWDQAEASDGKEILFTAQQSVGSGIDWSQAKWTFGDGSPAQYGPSASHRFAPASAAAVYKVSLTLTRRLANGEFETATRYKEVNIGSNEIKPVVKAKLNADGYLVLSAEESQGRGLMLDRCVWMFAGKGDNQSNSVSNESGTQNSSSWSFGASFTTTVNLGYYGSQIGISANYSGSNSNSSSQSNSASFTSENYHTGMTVRRYVDFNTQKTLTVSLNVYRQDPDGGIVGKTITVTVNLAEAAKGVSY